VTERNQRGTWAGAAMNLPLAAMVLIAVALCGANTACEGEEHRTVENVPYAPRLKCSFLQMERGFTCCARAVTRSECWMQRATR